MTEKSYHEKIVKHLGASYSGTELAYKITHLSKAAEWLVRLDQALERDRAKQDDKRIVEVH